MTAFSVFQVRSRTSGWLARPRQKLLTKSDFRVARISSKTALTFGCASASVSVQSLTMAILASVRARPGRQAQAHHGSRVASLLRVTVGQVLDHGLVRARRSV